MIIANRAPSVGQVSIVSSSSTGLAYADSSLTCSAHPTDADGIH